MNTYKCAWFINFNGIGNGIVIAPIIRCFEISFPTTSYFHSENEIFSNDWFMAKAGLNNLKGTSPIGWRRFERRDWDNIIDFIKLNHIDLIVNLRNEGPKYDSGYYEFKKFFTEKYKVTFWDLDFDNIEKRVKQENLTSDILKMFETNGVDTSHYNSKWLSTRHTTRQGFGFGMAASQKNKRWTTHKWIELANKISSDYPEQKIILFPGLSQEEIWQANEVQNNVERNKIEIVSNCTLLEITRILGTLKCFVTNDTGLLHICAATGTSTIGLYTNTDPCVWAPYDKTSYSSCINTFMNECPARKIYCGNCFHYYDSCPAIVQHGDNIDPEQVLNTINKTIA